MFLSIDEIKELTGNGQKSPCCKWLDENHYLYEINSKGWPVVLRSHVVARMGGTPTESKRPQLVLK